MNARTPHLPIWAALLLAGACIAAAGCNGLPRANPMSSREDLPDQEVTDFVLTETDAGHPQWTLYSKWAATYTARNVVVARDIRVDFFDEKGARSSELTAREGEIQQLTRDMTARGNVVLKTTEGLIETVERLLGNELRGTFTSEQGSVLSRRAFRRLRRRVDYSEYGGAPLLGVAGTAIVAHGRSSAKAIRNAIAMAARLASSDVVAQVTQRVAVAGVP